MVLDAQAESGQLLTVGFNRRFSPLVARAKEFFIGAEPLAIQYRINAGAIPSDSWVQDPTVGGGRVIGEVCHFIDLIEYFTADELVEVFAYSLGGHGGSLNDTVTISLKYRNGSIASINYFSTGDKSLPKELIEIYGGGGTAVLDDFRELTLSRNGRKSKVRRLSQEKGYDEEVAAFLSAVRSGGDAPIALESLVSTTRATFAIMDSLRTGEAVAVG